MDGKGNGKLSRKVFRIRERESLQVRERAFWACLQYAAKCKASLIQGQRNDYSEVYETPPNKLIFD